MEQARSGGHPLGVSVGDDTAAALGVLVLHDPVDHVCNRLEPTVRVPRCAFRFAGCVFHLAHLVEMDERVEVREVNAGEGAADRKAQSLEPLWCGRDGFHPPLGGGGFGDRDTRQRERVFDGDGGHINSNRYGSRYNCNYREFIPRCVRITKP